MAINSVNNSSIPFGEKKREESGGILFPAVAGAVAGTGVAAVWKGVSVGDLDKITQGKDEFVKLKKADGLSEEEKAAFQKVEDTFTTNPADKSKTGDEAKTGENKAKDETKPSEAKPAEAKPEAPTTEAPKAQGSKASVAAKGKTAKEIFGEAQELDPKDFIEKKYGQSIEDFTNEIKTLNVKDNSHEIKHNKRVASSAHKSFTEGVEEGKKLLAQERRIQGARIKVLEAKAVRDKITNKESSQYRNAQNRVEQLQKELSEQARAHYRMKEEVTKKFGKNEGFITVIEAADDVKANTHIGTENVTGKARKEITTKIKNDAAIQAEKDLVEIEKVRKEQAKTSANEAKKQLPALEEQLKAASEKAKAAIEAAKGAEGKLVDAQKQLAAASAKVSKGNKNAITEESLAKTEVERLKALITEKQTALDELKKTETVFGITQKKANSKYEPLFEETKADFIKKRQATALAAEQERIDAHVTIADQKEFNRRINAEIDEKISRSISEKSVHINKNLNRSEREISNTKASILERKQDWAMISDARKNNKKITVAQAEEIINTAAAEAKKGISQLVSKGKKGAKGKAGETPKVNGEEAKTVTDGIKDALKTLRKKLPKEFKSFNWKGLGIGAGIGLVGGVILKWIFGGKSEE